MQVFIQWITEIVLFLLLAMVADALLPSGAMRKYARLVMAILLLLVILDPLLQFLKLDPQQIIQSVESRMHTSIETEEMSGEIEDKKNEILRGQDAYTLQQVEEAVLDQLQKPLKADYELSLNQVEFKFLEEPYSMESLDKLILFVSSNSEEGDIEEVIISTSSEDTNQKLTVRNEDRDRIYKYVADQLDLNRQQIEIHWEEGHE
ncbi:stage III sporulation protein AF [Halobacillus sp. A1]|uniref:stage III sporulation protein AF n=1 Tax=Halobacillus sp. A1 TaxID=2880262 RepID=UPI0020A6A80E|nr:stage III sporulation protein AF [Halobacillus sp. A1]MCP3032978.1 stage III sporulation protein AF [Halobacillus sp. A1]